jgi:hypothetical protein
MREKKFLPWLRFKTQRTLARKFMAKTRRFTAKARKPTATTSKFAAQARDFTATIHKATATTVGLKTLKTPFF